MKILYSKLTIIEITQEQFEKAKENALKYFKNIEKLFLLFFEKLI